jgi:phenylacetate-CoA ligase
LKTSSPAITPLEAWIKARTGCDLTGRSFLEALKDYQLLRVNETIAYARRNTVFYRSHLACLPDAPLSVLSDIARIPFTTPSELTGNPMRFLAVRQDDIARIVTLRTSGSTGEAKRVFFTEGDLELTVDFFHHGMSTLVRPGQRVMVLLPGENPGSVGDLLFRGLQRMDVHTLVYGPVANPCHAAEAIAAFGANCLVGIPTQVLSVALSPEGTEIGKCGIQSVLLSTDYVPRAIAETLEKIWGCRVFTHYGMTETGFGGGVECDALDGYHLREGDLFFEVVDHETGKPCPEGVMGEVVVTTLTRQGMPLIRYRTGDISRIFPRPCPCGSVLRRMDRVRGRWDGAVHLSPGRILLLSDMDDVLFRLPGLLDYRACISMDHNGRQRLLVEVQVSEAAGVAAGNVLGALNAVEAIRKSVAEAKLETPTVRFSAEGRWTTTGVSKRKILVTNDPPG